VRLGYSPRVSFEQCLTATVDYVRRHPPTVVEYAI
jgi:hypothetical protein